MSQERVSHHCTTHPRPLGLAIVAAGWLLAARLPAAQAAPFTVNSTADAVDAHPGDGVCATATHVCTLRAAIQEANALAGADSITVPAGTFTLTLAGVDEDGAATGDLDITDDLTLTGAGAASTIIDGGGIDRVLDIFGAAANSPHVDIAKVTIQHGLVQGAVLDGGGIWNSGTLTLTDSTLSDNTAGDGGPGTSGIGQAGGSGGGLYNSGTLTLTNSILRRNTGGSGGTGGAGDPGGLGGTGGSGGGIYNRGTLTVTNSTLSENNAGTSGFANGRAGAGGGIANSGTLTVTNSTLSHNHAGNGLSNVEDLGGGAGAGGGIANSGTLTVINSTLSLNNAGNGGVGGYSGGSGGGIVNGGTLTVINSTLSLNNAGNGGSACCTDGGDGGSGGGIYNSGTLTVTNSTLSQNHVGGGAFASFGPGGGGGIANGGRGFSEGGGTVTLYNTILADNVGDFGGNCFHHFNATITDDGYNLASDTSCAFSAPTSLTNTDPLLLPLQDNGGPTDTQALCTGPGSPEASCPTASPALDVIPLGVNGCGTTVVTDQRGVLRPQGPGCDMGAVEAAADLLPFAALRTQVTLYRNALSKLTPTTDHFSIQGAFTLDPGSNGIAPPTEVVLFTLADRDGPFFTQTLPRGAFLPFGHGSFFFRAPVGHKGLQSLVLQGSASAGHFSFSVTGDKLDLRGANRPPVTVSLQIGADTGAQTLGCRKFKQGWRCQ